jgi:pimeloyl-ACP methyl ester carboxylesterase
VSTWVLLRGLMRESRHWGEFPLLFQYVMAEQNIVTIDFPGNGRLYKQHSANNMEEMVSHCRTQLCQLGYAPPYRVLALSLGAMAAVAWSERYPTEIEKLVLINTSLGPVNPFYHRLRPKNYPALSMLLLGSSTQRESLILKLTSMRSRTEKMGTVLQQWINYADECPITRSNILRQLHAAFTYRMSLTMPQVPLLLLASEHDQLVSVQCTLKLAQHWGCAIRLHPTAGHDLPLDDGVWVADQVKEWLAI